jgi:hypothetical protein
MFRLTAVTGVVLLALAAVPASAGSIVSAPLDDVLTPGCVTASQEVVVQEGVEVDFGTLSTCTASADCGAGWDVSCVGSGTCTAVDRDCGQGERGHVVCDGNFSYCSANCDCTDGAIRYVDTGGCCKDFLKKQSYQRCIDGHWVHQYYTCYPVPFCPEM